MLYKALYRKVFRALRKCEAYPQHLDDMRFVIDPNGFRSTCIAVEATPSILRKPGRDKAVPTNKASQLPQHVRETCFSEALNVTRQIFRHNEGMDVAKAFWAAKRLEDIHNGLCPSANGVFWDDTTAVSTLYQAPFPFSASFIGADSFDSIPVARGAENSGAVVFARSRCANSEDGPTRFHVRLSLFNNDAIHPLLLLNTHMFIVTVTDSPTLTEMTSVMPVMNEPVRPTVTDNDVSSEPVTTAVGELESAKENSVEGLEDQTASVNTSAVSAMEFDFVIPVETKAVLRGILYYCHMPASTVTMGTNRSVKPKSGNAQFMSHQSDAVSDGVLNLRHPAALEYNSLHALAFGPLKLDPEVTSYTKLAEWV